MVEMDSLKFIKKQLKLKVLRLYIHPTFTVKLLLLYMEDLCGL